MVDLFEDRSLPLRVLSLWRPWPHSMHGWVEQTPDGYRLHPGPKAIENRNWHPPQNLVGRCFVALQSGLTHDPDAEAFLLRRGWDYRGPMPKGAITGVAFLSGHFGTCDRRRRGLTCTASHQPCPPELREFYMGEIGWHLTDRVPLIEPVPFKCGQGLRSLPLDADARVRAEYRRTVEVLGSQLPPGRRLV